MTAAAAAEKVEVCRRCGAAAASGGRVGLPRRRCTWAAGGGEQRRRRRARRRRPSDAASWDGERGGPWGWSGAPRATEGRGGGSGGGGGEVLETPATSEKAAAMVLLVLDRLHGVVVVVVFRLMMTFPATSPQPCDERRRHPQGIRASFFCHRRCARARSGYTWRSRARDGSSCLGAGDEGTFASADRRAAAMMPHSSSILLLSGAVKCDGTLNICRRRVSNRVLAYAEPRRGRLVREEHLSLHLATRREASPPRRRKHAARASCQPETLTYLSAARSASDRRLDLRRLRSSVASGADWPRQRSRCSLAPGLGLAAVAVRDMTLGAA